MEASCHIEFHKLRSKIFPGLGFLTVSWGPSCQCCRRSRGHWPGDRGDPGAWSWPALETLDLSLSPLVWTPHLLTLPHHHPPTSGGRGRNHWLIYRWVAVQAVASKENCQNPSLSPVSQSPVQSVLTRSNFCHNPSPSPTPKSKVQFQSPSQESKS